MLQSRYGTNAPLTVLYGAGPLAELVGATRSWHTTDALGSVGKMLSDCAAIVQCRTGQATGKTVCAEMAIASKGRGSLASSLRDTASIRIGRGRASPR